MWCRVPSQSTSGCGWSDFADGAGSRPERRNGRDPGCRRRRARRSHDLRHRPRRRRAHCNRALPFAANGGRGDRQAGSLVDQHAVRKCRVHGRRIHALHPLGAGCAAQHTCSTGTYDWAFALHDPAASPAPTDALGPCHALGPDVSVVSGCGGFAAGVARTTVTSTGELPVAGDTVTLAMTNGSLGTASKLVAGGRRRGSPTTAASRCSEHRGSPWWPRSHRPAARCLRCA